jgi:hypothetical protein
MTNQASIVTADARLVRLPVDPPRGDAIQTFDALELPIVDITDHAVTMAEASGPPSLPAEDDETDRRYYRGIGWRRSGDRSGVRTTRRGY